MFKKVVSLIFAFVLSISLTACGGDEKNDLKDVVMSSMRAHIFSSSTNAETFVNAEPAHVIVKGEGVDESVNRDFSEDTFLVLNVKDNSVYSVLLYADKLEPSPTAQELVDAGISYLPDDTILEKYFKKPVYKKYRVKNDSSEEVHYLIGYKRNLTALKGSDKELYNHDISVEVVEVDGVFTRMFVNPYFEDAFKGSDNAAEEKWDLNK